jgi:hypothetical protein
MEVHADQGVVQRLFDIMDRIEENMQRAQSVERDAERTRSADYAELKEKVEDQMMYTQGQLLDLASFCDTLENRIGLEQMKMANIEQSAVSLETRLADRSAECEQDTAVWEQFY